MFVRFGDYDHEPGEVQLARESEFVRAEDQRILSRIDRFQLAGELIGSSESDIDAKVEALLAAYVDGKDLALVMTSGDNTQLVLDSSACVNGTIVDRPPSFPDMKNAAYVTFLPYVIAVSGETLIASEGDDVISFRETVARSGGGPRYGHKEVLRGAPIKHQLRTATTFRVIQSGQAEGLFGYPVPPPPLNPSALIENPDIQLESPVRRSRNRWTNYRISWSYTMESAYPLNAIPNKQR